MSEASPITLPRYLSSDVTAMLEHVATRLVREGARELREIDAPEPSSMLFAPAEDAPTPAEAYDAVQGRWIEVTRTRQTLVHGDCQMTDAALADWFRIECRLRLAAIRAEIAA